MIDILVKYMSDFTLMSDDEQRSISESLRIDQYKKGKYLLKQGELSTIKCYFVLSGCVRQFFYRRIR